MSENVWRQWKEKITLDKKMIKVRTGPLLRLIVQWDMTIKDLSAHICFCDFYQREGSNNDWTDIGKGKENSRWRKKLYQCSHLPGKPPEGGRIAAVWVGQKGLRILTPPVMIRVIMGKMLNALFCIMGIKQLTNGVKFHNGYKELRIESNTVRQK